MAKRPRNSNKEDNEFILEDESVSKVKRKNVHYTEKIKTSAISDALENVVDIEVPVKPEQDSEVRETRKLNADIIKAFKQAEGDFELNGEESYNIDLEEELVSGDTLIEIQEETVVNMFQDDEDIDIMEDTTEEEIVDMDEEPINILGTDVMSFDDDDYDELMSEKEAEQEDISMEAIGGKEILQQDEIPEIDGIEEDDELADGVESEISIIEEEEEIDTFPTEEDEDIVDMRDDEEEQYLALEAGLMKTAKLLKNITEYQPEKERLHAQRITSSLSDENLSDIAQYIDKEDLSEIESSIYKVPSDIKKYYSNNGEEDIENIDIQVEVKIEDLTMMLENVATAIKPSTFILTHKRKISKSLVEELSETGRHYIEAQEIVPGTVPSNVEIIQKGDKLYYSFVTIPIHYTGYRTPLKKFLKDIESGVKDTLMNEGVLELSLLDENEINILTYNEFNQVIKMIKNTGLYFEIKKNKLIISC